ncbi:MAG: hypothetical protein V3R99_00240 [Thermoguttaceae bacterium]
MRHSLIWWLTALTVLLFGLWTTFGFHLLRGQANDTSHRLDVRPVLPARPADDRLPSGPWGRLKRTAIFLPNPSPLGLLPEPLSSPTATWYFPDTSRAQLNGLFSRIGLSDSLARTLLGMAKTNASYQGLTILPTPEIVLGLSPKIRSGLYAILAEFELNEDQEQSPRFVCDSADQWFAGAGLSPEIRDIVDPLVYRQGKVLYFSDLRTVDYELPSPEARLALREALLRRPALVVRLTASNDSDAAALVDYWGQGGRTSAVRPFIESLVLDSRCESVDVAHLLPPFPRRLLYTFPSATDGGSTTMLNCHWTSLNFFSEEPDPTFGEPHIIDEVIERDYVQVFDEPLLGDVVLFRSDAGHPIHSASFIADDIVFTKNGRGALPWTLMEIDHLLALYSADKIEYYRRRDL